MPPQTKREIPAQPPKYTMPTPTPVVVWSNAPGGEAVYGIVTKVGRRAISLMLFPSESRVGVPKDSVRHVGDPDNKAQANSDSGVWDYTDESKLIRALASVVFPDGEGHTAPMSPELIEFVNRVTK